MKATKLAANETLIRLLRADLAEVTKKARDHAIMAEQYKGIIMYLDSRLEQLSAESEETAAADVPSGGEGSPSGVSGSASFHSVQREECKI